MKICNRCGNNVADENQFCGYCGAPADSYISNQQQQVQYNEQFKPNMYQNNYGYNGNAMMNTNKSYTKMIATIVIIVCSILVLFISYFVFFGKGYEKPVKEIVKLLNKKENEDYKYNEFFLPKSAHEYEKIIFEAYGDSEYIEQLVEILEEYFGDDYKISVKITSADKMDENDVEKYAGYYKNMADYWNDNKEWMEEQFEYGAKSGIITYSEADELIEAYENRIDEYNKIKVSSGYELDISVEIEGDEDIKFKLKNVPVIKVNGKWIIYDMDDFCDEFYDGISDELE